MTDPNQSQGRSAQAKAPDNGAYGVLDLTPEQIATACHVPLDAARANWPLILQALKDLGIGSQLVQVGAAATVAVETGCFRPIQERMADPSKQADLASRQAKYYPFQGRGFIQLTWERNYRTYGDLIGVDLVDRPDQAKDPAIAARVLALYFKRSGVDRACNSEDWRAVRRLVNGGYNGMDRFQACVNALLEVVE